MKSLVLATILCAVAADPTHAADSSAKKNNKSKGTAKKESPVTQSPFDWTVSAVPGGAKLEISYTVHNPGAQPLYVCDKLVVPKGSGKYTRTSSPVVMNGDAPGVIRVVLGAVSSNRPAAMIYPPTYRAVAPGQSMQGKVELALPLKAWHPVGGANPLQPDARLLSFEVQTIEGEPAKWATLASDDPEPLKVPDGVPMKLLKTEPKPIPNS